MENKTRNYVITVGSLIALIIGFIFGIVLKETSWSFSSQLVTIFELVGKIWVNLLIILVIPLSVSYLISVILSMISTSSLGKLGGYALLIHTGILLTGIIFSVFTGFTIIYLIGDNRGTVMKRHKFGQVKINRIIGGVIP